MIKWNEIQVGDTVLLTRAETKTIKVDKIRYGNCIITDTGSYHYKSNWNEDVELIERSVTTPVNWPPQIGDVWETSDGREWFARKYKGSYKPDSTVTVVSFEDDNDLEYDMEKFLTLSPVCLRRRNK